ncbi:hypothetical protein E1265_01255 [Streptomyces sp. 8K308]|nr:hypothetical protein E1265_01255 [Streptomyces sp. 8K308]
MADDDGIRRRAVLLPLTLAIPLTACGAGASPDRAELEARAAALESAVELVYVTEVSGFELAPQSVAPAGADGFQSTYVASADGATIHLVVDRGTVDPATCGCEPDGEHVWYRAGDTHAYLREEDGHTVTVEGPSDTVTRETLRAALDEAHPADDEELAATLPEAQGDAGVPAERGDLPAHGDGAPVDPEGASG